MKITNKGILFNKQGDEILWMWPWNRPGGGYKYYSSVFARNFYDLSDYWQFVGVWNEVCRKEKVVGFSEGDVFLEWAKSKFRHNIAIVMRNVNVEVKSTLFWKSIPYTNRNELLKDIPVLFFRDQVQAFNVVESIHPEFAEAYLFVYGELVHSNSYEIGDETELDSGDYPGPH